MTYEASNPLALIAQTVGDSGVAMWIYKDGDNLATVTANGYISDAAELGLKANDTVLHVDTTNNKVTQLVACAWTNGTAVGAKCSAIEPVGETSIALTSAGTGTILVGDIIKFSNDPDSEYRITTGDADVSGGGTLVITPGLVTATEVGTFIEVQSDVLNLKTQNASSVVKSLTAATVLTANDSGTTFGLNLAGGFDVTLPAPLNGVEYEFIVQTAPTTAYTVTATGNIVYGTLSMPTGGVVAVAAKDVTSFVANTAAIGDRVKMKSDGTNWYATGFTGVNGGITIA